MQRRLRLLFVCSMNRSRSPTAEILYKDDPRIETRSAGARVTAKRPVTADELQWADIAFVMEREQKHWIAAHFKESSLPIIEILEIPDDYSYMAPNLQERLRLSVDSILGRFLDRPDVLAALLARRATRSGRTGRQSQPPFKSALPPARQSKPPFKIRS
jgi:predicted protein tyrosine phosphatase